MEGRWATNHILHEVQYKSDFTDCIIPLSSTILILDAYDGGYDLNTTFCRTETSRKVTNFNNNHKVNVRRDVLKMLTKKNSCTCLKDLYAQARRTIPKLGICRNCNQPKDRSSLMLCGYVFTISFVCRSHSKLLLLLFPIHSHDMHSHLFSSRGCMFYVYCSRECQAAEWGQHKSECAAIVQHKTKGRDFEMSS